MHQFIDFSLRHWELWTAFFAVLLILIILEVRNNAMSTGISAQEATLLINREDAIVLDIRDASSFAKGHIINAINVPQDDLDKQLTRIKKHGGKPIIIVYNQGQSFAKVILLLAENGFTKIHSLKEGIAGWQNAGLPLIKG
jgi:rhodanese-related sulfurtransferase